MLEFSKFSLTQLSRFLVVEPIQPDTKPKFDPDIAFMTNYSFSSRRRPVDSDAPVVTL